MQYRYPFVYAILVALASLLYFSSEASAFSIAKSGFIGSISRRGGAPLSMVMAPPGMKPDGSGGFKVAGAHPEEFVLENDNGARAVIRTYGCNAFTYKTKDGIEVMGTRADAPNPQTDAKPYAGGNPHCFPQFGPGPLPQHGFARGMIFIPEERAKKLSFDRMIYKLVPTPETKEIWPYDFEYRVDITLREDCLEWEVIVKNLGDQEFDYTHGLHTYFDVSSLANVEIEGQFQGASTLDRIKECDGTGDSNTLKITEPVDMMYRGVTAPIVIKDTGKGTKVTIEREGYTDTCVWSPYGNEAQGYDKFICVEPICGTPVKAPVGKFKETKYMMRVRCDKL